MHFQFFTTQLHFWWHNQIELQQLSFSLAVSMSVAFLSFPLENMLETVTCLVQRVLLWSISALGLAWIYKELTMGICHSKKRLDGKVAIVTGMILSHLYNCYGINQLHIRWERWDWL